MFSHPGLRNRLRIAGPSIEGEFHMPASTELTLFVAGLGALGWLGLRRRRRGGSATPPPVPFTRGQPLERPEIQDKKGPTSGRGGAVQGDRLERAKC